MTHFDTNRDHPDRSGKSCKTEEVVYNIVWEFTTTVGQVWDYQGNCVVFEKATPAGHSPETDPTNETTKSDSTNAKPKSNVKLVMPARSIETKKAANEAATEEPGLATKTEEAKPAGESSSNCGPAASTDMMEGVQNSEDALAEEEKPTYRATLKWREWRAEHSCVPIPGDKVGFWGYTDFELIRVNELMAKETREDSVTYEFVDEDTEFDDNGFPFLKLQINCGYSGSAPTGTMAWCKASSGRADSWALTSRERGILRDRGDFDMEGSEENEDEDDEEDEEDEEDLEEDDEEYARALKELEDKKAKLEVERDIWKGKALSGQAGDMEGEMKVEETDAGEEK